MPVFEIPIDKRADRNYDASVSAQELEISPLDIAPPNQSISMSTAPSLYSADASLRGTPQTSLMNALQHTGYDHPAHAHTHAQPPSSSAPGGTVSASASGASVTVPGFMSPRELEMRESDDSWPRRAAAAAATHMAGEWVDKGVSG